LLASVGIGIAWLTYKPKYTAVATMRMSINKQRILPGVPSDEAWRSAEEFQKTEAHIVKSRDVLQTTLQKDRIRGLVTIRNQEDPVLWLEKELQAWFVPGTDIFRIALNGEDPEEITLIVNTVKDVYVTHYVDTAKKQQADRLLTLVNVMVDAEE